MSGIRTFNPWGHVSRADRANRQRILAWLAGDSSSEYRFSRIEAVYIGGEELARWWANDSELQTRVREFAREIIRDSDGVTEVVQIRRRGGIAPLEEVTAG